MTDSTTPAKKSKRRRRGGGGGGGGNGQKAKRVDLWRPVPVLAAPDPIEAVVDPTALVRSLGQPPLQGQGALGERNLVLVVKNASEFAMGMAHAFGFKAEPAADLDEP